MACKEKSNSCTWRQPDARSTINIRKRDESRGAQAPRPRCPRFDRQRQLLRPRRTHPHVSDSPSWNLISTPFFCIFGCKTRTSHQNSTDISWMERKNSFAVVADKGLVCLPLLTCLFSPFHYTSVNWRKARCCNCTIHTFGDAAARVCTAVRRLFA